MSVPVATVGQSLLSLYFRIKTVPWAIVYVALAPDAAANKFLHNAMQSVVPGIAFEAVPWTDLLSNKMASDLCAKELTGAGIGLRAVSPGYYLFHKGQVCGFHAAVPASDHVGPGALFSLGVGVIDALAGGRDPIGTMASVGLALWEVAGALEAAAHFKKLISILHLPSDEEEESRRRSERARQIQQESTINDIDLACQVLGVSMTSSQDEVKRAFRAAARAAHPDLNPGSDDEAMKRVNHARAVYYAYRGWTD